MSRVSPRLQEIVKGLDRLLPYLTWAKMHMGICTPQAKRLGWGLAIVAPWRELRASLVNLSRAKDVFPRYPPLHRIFLGEKIVQGPGQVKRPGL